LNSGDKFSKNSEILNFIKIRPVGADFSIRTEGQTDMTKLMFVIFQTRLKPRG